MVCPSCGEKVVIDLSSVGFNEIELDEKNMGAEKGYEAEPDSVFCPNCGYKFKSLIVYEYPDGRYTVVPE